MNHKKVIVKLDKEGFNYNIEEDAIYNTELLGLVEDNNDPLNLGRCKIRVPRIHAPEIKTEDIPWASPTLSMFFGKTGKAGAISIPKIGALVQITLAERNHNNIEYFAMQELADDVVALLSEEHDGVHVLGMDGDEDLKVYFTPKRGLNFYLKGSFINISPDRAITIEHKDTKSQIEFREGTITINADSQVNINAGTRIQEYSPEVWTNGKTTKLGRNPQYSSVLGEPLMALLEIMANVIDAKLYPTPNVLAAAVKELKKTILSNTVKVSQ